ncbi:MAG: precorrin-2 C(20)-methyltransferase [Paracoccaceae bacterium]
MTGTTPRGTLFGIGLGPGAPDLMTLRAARLVARAPVVAYPAPEEGESFARSIASETISPTAEEIAIRIPMRADRFPAQEIYDAAAHTLAERLADGQDVAVLCEGDPFFYGSFMYLFARLADRERVEIVPGVTSLTACAAAAARPLCARNEALTAIPAPLDDREIASRLAMGGAAAILKVGRHLGRVRRLLASLGQDDRAVFVAHASLAQQAVLPLADAPDPAPYFSMILVPGEDPYAG